MNARTRQDSPSQISPSHDDPMGRLATRLRNRGLGDAALLALELLKPVGLMLSQLLVMVEPLLGERLCSGAVSCQRLLQDPNEMSRLSDLLAGEASTTARTEEAPCQPSPS